MKKLIPIVFLLYLISSCSPSKTYTQGMRDELKSMFDKDQDLQNWDSSKISDQKYTDSMRNQMNKLIKKNCDVIKQYYVDYGFPGIKKNEGKTSMYFWLITLHSDHDLIFQQQILREMKKGIKTGDASKQNYAYLYDRIKKNKKEAQRYGTQVEYSGWDVIPYKLEKPLKVEELRKDVGLDSLKTYLASFRN